MVIFLLPSITYTTLKLCISMLQAILQNSFNLCAKIATSIYNCTKSANAIKLESLKLASPLDPNIAASNISLTELEKSYIKELGLKIARKANSYLPKAAQNFLVNHLMPLATMVSQYLTLGNITIVLVITAIVAIVYNAQSILNAIRNRGKEKQNELEQIVNALNEGITVDYKSYNEKDYTKYMEEIRTQLKDFNLANFFPRNTKVLIQEQDEMFRRSVRATKKDIDKEDNLGASILGGFGFGFGATLTAEVVANFIVSILKALTITVVIAVYKSIVSNVVSPVFSYIFKYPKLIAAKALNLISTATKFFKINEAVDERLSFLLCVEHSLGVIKKLNAIEGQEGEFNDAKKEVIQLINKKVLEDEATLQTLFQILSTDSSKPFVDQYLANKSLDNGMGLLNYVIAKNKNCDLEGFKNFTDYFLNRKNIKVQGEDTGEYSEEYSPLIWDENIATLVEKTADSHPTIKSPIAIIICALADSADDVDATKKMELFLKKILMSNMERRDYDSLTLLVKEDENLRTIIRNVAMSIGIGGGIKVLTGDCRENEKLRLEFIVTLGLNDPRFINTLINDIYNKPGSHNGVETYQNITQPLLDVIAEHHKKIHNRDPKFNTQLLSSFVPILKVMHEIVTNDDHSMFFTTANRPHIHKEHAQFIISPILSKLEIIYGIIDECGEGNAYVPISDLDIPNEVEEYIDKLINAMNTGDWQMMEANNWEEVIKGCCFHIKRLIHKNNSAGNTANSDHENLFNKIFELANPTVTTSNQALNIQKLQFILKNKIIDENYNGGIEFIDEIIFNIFCVDSLGQATVEHQSYLPILIKNLPHVISKASKEKKDITGNLEAFKQMIKKSCIQQEASSKPGANMTSPLLKSFFELIENSNTIDSDIFIIYCNKLLFPILKEQFFDKGNTLNTELLKTLFDHLSPNKRNAKPKADINLKNILEYIEFYHNYLQIDKDGLSKEQADKFSLGVLKKVAALTPNSNNTGEFNEIIGMLTMQYNLLSKDGDSNQENRENLLKAINLLCTEFINKKEHKEISKLKTSALKEFVKNVAIFHLGKEKTIFDRISSQERDKGTEGIRKLIHLAFGKEKDSENKSEREELVKKDTYISLQVIDHILSNHSDTTSALNTQGIQLMGDFFKFISHKTNNIEELKANLCTLSDRNRVYIIKHMKSIISTSGISMNRHHIVMLLDICHGLSKNTNGSASKSQEGLSSIVGLLDQILATSAVMAPLSVSAATEATIKAQNIKNMMEAGLITKEAMDAYLEKALSLVLGTTEPSRIQKFKDTNKIGSITAFLEKFKNKDEKHPLDLKNLLYTLYHTILMDPKNINIEDRYLENIMQQIAGGAINEGINDFKQKKPQLYKEIENACKLTHGDNKWDIKTKNMVKNIIKKSIPDFLNSDPKKEASDQYKETKGLQIYYSDGLSAELIALYAKMAGILDSAIEAEKSEDNLPKGVCKEVSNLVEKLTLLLTHNCSNIDAGLYQASLYSLIPTMLHFYSSDLLENKTKRLIITLINNLQLDAPGSMATRENKCTYDEQIEAAVCKLAKYEEGSEALIKLMSVFGAENIIGSLKRQDINVKDNFFKFLANETVEAIRHDMQDRSGYMEHSINIIMLQISGGTGKSAAIAKHVMNEEAADQKISILEWVDKIGSYIDEEYRDQLHMALIQKIFDSMSDYGFLNSLLRDIQNKNWDQEYLIQLLDNAHKFTEMVLSCEDSRDVYAKSPYYDNRVKNAKDSDKTEFTLLINTIDYKTEILTKLYRSAKGGDNMDDIYSHTEEQLKQIEKILKSYKLNEINVNYDAINTAQDRLRVLLRNIDGIKNCIITCKSDTATKNINKDGLLRQIQECENAINAININLESANQRKPDKSAAEDQCDFDCSTTAVAVNFDNEPPAFGGM